MAATEAAGAAVVAVEEVVADAPVISTVPVTSTSLVFSQLRLLPELLSDQLAPASVSR